MNSQPTDPRKSFVPDPENTRLLRDAFGQFATGVTIVTAQSEGRCVAITASSFSPVSLSPPLVLWSASRGANRYPFFEAAESYAIHVLEASQSDLCWKVAGDVFALKDQPLTINTAGVPLLQDCLACFECTRKALYDGGDHAIMLGHVDKATMRDTGEALTFFKGEVRQFTAP